jgi:hypothetical protein
LAKSAFPFKKLYPQINNSIDAMTKIAVLISLDSFKIIFFLQN